MTAIVNFIDDDLDFPLKSPGISLLCQTKAKADNSFLNLTTKQSLSIFVKMIISSTQTPSALSRLVKHSKMLNIVELVQFLFFFCLSFFHFDNF